MKAQAQARGPAPGGLPYLFVDDDLYKLREMSSDAATLDRTYRTAAAARQGAGQVRSQLLLFTQQKLNKILSILTALERCNFLICGSLLRGIR